MDHQAYENQMIDGVNRHADESTGETVDMRWTQVVTRNDKRIVTRGLKRTLLALLTALTFAFSVLCFVAVAKAPGYLAVALFITAIVAMGCSFFLLYAQGISRIESKGERK